MLISRASREVNEATVENFFDFHLSDTLNPKRIALLGLAFKGKPETKDLRGSAVYPVHHRLHTQFPNAIFTGYEPAGVDELDLPHFSIANSISEAVSDADLVILLTNSESFTQSPEQIASLAQKDALVLDFWSRQFQNSFLSSQTYISWSEGTK